MRRHILVIDDDEGIRKSFLLALEGTDYQVEAVESGESGIKKMQDARYDLIFLDLKMPGLDGVQTLKKLRKIDEDVPVYIVTAFYQEFFKGLKSAEKEGMNFEVVKKPVGTEQIVMVTQGVLEGPTRY